MDGGLLRHTPKPATNAAHRRQAQIAAAGCIAFFVLLTSTATVSAQSAGNKYVRTWAWADEVVQPKSNAVARKARTSSAGREIALQLLTSARRAAELGKLDIAEQLARRAEAAINAHIAQGGEGWDPAEQTPASFLRQLAAAKQQHEQERQADSRANRKSVPSADIVGLEDESAAPPPPQLSDEELAQSARMARRKEIAQPRIGDSESFKDEPDFNWSAKPSVDYPAPAVTADLEPEDTHHGHGEAVARPIAAPAAPKRVVHKAKTQVNARPTQPRIADNVVPANEPNRLRDAAAAGAAAATKPAAPVMTERIIQLRDDSANEPPRSVFADAIVQLLSTAAGLILGIVLLGGVRLYLKRKYNADFGFVFRVEHIATDEDGMPISYQYPYHPAMGHGETLPMPTAGPGRNGSGAVLCELPMGFQSDDVSPYEEELQKQEEAENEMMKLVLQQNLALREKIGSRKESAA